MAFWPRHLVLLTTLIGASAQAHECEQQLSRALPTAAQFTRLCPALGTVKAYVGGEAGACWVQFESDSAPPDVSDPSKVQAFVCLRLEAPAADAKLEPQKWKGLEAFRAAAKVYATSGGISWSLETSGGGARGCDEALFRHAHAALVRQSKKK